MIGDKELCALCKFNIKITHNDGSDATLDFLKLCEPNIRAMFFRNAIEKENYELLELAKQNDLLTEF